MAKTKTELLQIAAGIINEIVESQAGDNLGTEFVRKRALAWLQEEISEEAGGPSSPQGEELPTDDRWFAAYLKGIEAFGRISAVNPGMMANRSAMESCKTFAKAVADDALAAAREQAMEVRA